MISGLGNESLSYRTRYLQFPSTMTGNVPSISKPAVHVIKIRFNNVFKDEKFAFAVISVILSIILLLVGMGLYSTYKSLNSYATTNDMSAMDGLKEISAADNISEKSSFFASGSSGANQTGKYISFNNGSSNPAQMLAMENENQSESSQLDKSILTSKKVILKVDEKEVMNPFMPYNEKPYSPVKKKVTVTNPNYLTPPTSLGIDSDANKLLTKTSVSGIMYDSYSPSAIIKIEDVDYFVKKGDEVQGFKILGINKNTVVIKRGANVYDANVGRTLATLEPNTTGTSNISNKFGGSTR